MNPLMITETYELIRVIENIKKPASFLLERLFPQTETILSDILPVEYLKGGRRLAPFVVKGAKPTNIAREKTTINFYRGPLIGARRVISINDIERRIIGENPIYSTLTAEQRAAQIQGNDLKELQAMLINRRAKMCADLIQTGKIEVKGFADDGRLAEEDTIEFPGFQTITKNWSLANAKIFDDLEEASETIQENYGSIPTLLVCGKNILSYMRNNTQFKEFLLSANANAVSWLNFQPQYQSPQVRFIGYLPPLNLEVVSYLETFTDDDGTVKPFIDKDSAILCCPGNGKMLYGTVTYLDQSGNWNTASAECVPVYSFSQDAQATSLSLYSRCLPIPEDISSFIHIKAKP